MNCRHTTAESLAAVDLAFRIFDVINGIDQPIVEPFMISFDVEVFHLRTDRFTQPLHVEEEKVNRVSRNGAMDSSHKAYL